MREETSLWLRQAQSDIHYAKANLEIGAYYVCAFLGVQAAEMSLKALYIESKREPAPRSHNLVDLGTRLEMPEALLSQLREINADYTVSRYPDAANALPSEIFDEPITSRHLRIAEEVVRWAETQITSAGS